MNQREAYSKVAERALSSSDALVGANLQEASAFFSYHAFESLGGQLCAHLARPYPKAHERKITEFVIQSRRQVFGHAVSTLATALRSLGRNRMLYPSQLPGTEFGLPQDRLKPANARDLLRRVRGVARSVSRFCR